MVIDDVWQAADLAPFMRGGPNCARLLTTRHPDILPRGTVTTAVDAMRPDEAARLLGADFPLGHEFALTGLAKRLGNWPILLKLANKVLLDHLGANATPRMRSPTSPRTIRLLD